MNSGLYTLLAKQIKGQLEPYGFKAARSHYYRNSNDLRQLIWLKKIRQSSSASLRISVSLGLVSLPIADILGTDPASIHIDDCHWRMPLHQLVPGGKIWWDLGSNIDTGSICREIVDNIIQFGLPMLCSIPSTKSLEDLWLSGSCGGLFETQRVEYLGLLGHTVLPNKHNNADVFKTVVSVLEKGGFKVDDTS